MFIRSYKHFKTVVLKLFSERLKPEFYEHLTTQASNIVVKLQAKFWSSRTFLIDITHILQQWFSTFFSTKLYFLVGIVVVQSLFLSYLHRLIISDRMLVFLRIFLKKELIKKMQRRCYWHVASGKSFVFIGY